MVARQPDQFNRQQGTLELLWETLHQVPEARVRIEYPKIKNDTLLILNPRAPQRVALNGTRTPSLHPLGEDLALTLAGHRRTAPERIPEWMLLRMLATRTQFVPRRTNNALV